MFIKVKVIYKVLKITMGSNLSLIRRYFIETFSDKNKSTTTSPAQTLIKYRIN